MLLISIVCLLWIAAVSVSCSHSEELTGIVGGRINIPNSLTKGTLMYKGTVIGDVSNGNIRIDLDERFTGRLQWDSSTGFSITDLKLEDSGEYTMQNNGEEFTYHLKIHGNRTGAAPAGGHFSALSCFFVLILVQFFL
ncbi:hypothetical protein MATL_G00220850 [Megalops atlanticus]|uniref:Uncharacterized protein n=1 Tax=Megalops atlanticus TaxID=7932 RepID=A0A9D3PH71_MEGAT|nr:hypothetical protein MATL_G00220850 [Megalops atlanticus]